MNKAQYITLMENTLSQAPQSQSPAMPVRKLSLDLSDGFDRHWHGGDGFRTAYYNALSMSFPLGEQLFINSVQDCAPLLPEPTTEQDVNLRAQIKDFCAQEATHRHVHAQYNAQLAQHGLHNHVEERIAKRDAYVKTHGIKPIHRLAVTAAYEHYTAVFASILLANPQTMAGADAQMRKIWMWHAMEESEHKAVAYDVYQAIGGNYAWRVRWFIYASIVFAFDVLRQTTNNLWHDGTLFKPSTWWSATTFLFGRPSRGNGWMWMMTRPLLDYFKRDFHPWQHNNRTDLAEYADAHGTDWRVVRAGSAA